MKTAQDTIKIEIVRKTSKMENRKGSADYRYRQRVKDRSSTPSSALLCDRLRETIGYEKEKTGCLNTIFHKELESRTYAEKCVNLLSKKKMFQKEEQPQVQVQPKNKFNSMLQNIKNVIKENEKKGKETKGDAEPLINNQFQCVRSQIHQIYSNEEKMDLYRMIRHCESKAGSRRESTKFDKYEKTEPEGSPRKAMINPFFNLNTVVCFTMALNDPNRERRQTLFEPPLSRNSFSAYNKRTVNISKSTHNKPMAFHLSGDNDGQYCRKLKNFFDFLFKVNFSNNIYVSLELNKNDDISSLVRYKVYVGKGNNSLLIKSLLKRRYWWQITDNLESQGVNFYWSQNIVDKIEARQERVRISDINIEKMFRRRKETDDLMDQNRKILSSEKCKKVESLITKDGYNVPFEEAYVPDMMTNHLPRNYCIGSKKNLFKSLFHYFTQKHKNPFDYVPKTYHIRSTEDQEYLTFVRENKSEPGRVWIVKPGENSNRGKGIQLSTFGNLSRLIRRMKQENGQSTTYIIQSYIDKPFLYNSRKFDIRHFMMLTSVNGVVKAYWYKDGYVRTASELYDVEDLDNQFVHLTNDAIQKNSEEYEKYEPANKLSYSELQRYLDYSYPGKNYSLEREILPKMKEMAAYIIRANYQTIDHRRHRNNFEIFGLDFMIDRDFKPWLIEVNYNPCLEVNCPVLERVIPVMLEHSFRLGLDPLFPPTTHYPASKRFNLSDNYLKNLKYELIFDEDSLRNPQKSSYSFVDEKEKEEEFPNEGQEVVELVP